LGAQVSGSESEAAAIKSGDGFAQGEQFGDLSVKVCQAEPEEVADVFAWWVPGVPDL